MAPKVRNFVCEKVLDQCHENRRPGTNPHSLPPTQAKRLSPKTTQPLNQMESTMQYKTIVLELLQQRHEMHDRLRRDRMLLRAMEHYVQELKQSHESWKERLEQARPGSHASQTASEALEMALAELEARLPTVFPSEEELSLDKAMAFLRKHISTG
jgi:hypothetical protein